MGSSGTSPTKAEDVLGILVWEYDFPSFRKNPGDLQNPGTFDFPVRLLRVPGANLETIVRKPTAEVDKAMVDGAKKLEREGVRAIVTSCGFNARIQRQLAAAVTVPVFASSLLLVPLAHRMIRKGRAVGILTADAPALKEEHLRAIGVEGSMKVCIRGLQDSHSFITNDSHPGVDSVSFDDLKTDVVNGARALVEENKDVGAIVLECAALPPFADEIREVVRVPVFDIVELARTVCAAVCW